MSISEEFQNVRGGGQTDIPSKYVMKRGGTDSPLRNYL